MEHLLASLNPPQREAVENTEGPLLIVAGAGSGKTKALTTRVAYIVGRGLARPENILAVTFTNKAAGEMRERVAHILGAPLPSLGMTTFHSFCARFLRIEANAAGYPKDYSIYDEEDARSLLKRCVEEIGLSGTQFSAQSLKRQISNLKNEMVGAEEFAGRSQGYFDSRVAQVYLRYEASLRRFGAMDFDDLIVNAVRLLERDAPLRERYREKFRYVLVDEYQDTNRTQYMLLRNLVGDAHNICVVGDEDQSIYGWRGADIRNIQDFEKDYPNAKVVILEDNYRSTQIILDAAGSVIANNQRRKEKRLRANVSGGEPLQFILCDNAAEEARLALEEVSALSSAVPHVPYSQMVILYRTNAQSRAFEDTLVRKKIPYQIIGGVGFYQRKEIKDLIAYLKLIANTKDDISLARILNYPKRGLGDTTLGRLVSAASARGMSLYGVLLDSALRAEHGGRGEKTLTAFVETIETLRAKAGFVVSPEAIHQAMPVDLLVQELLGAIEIEKEIFREDPEPVAVGRIENINEFVSAAIQFSQKSPEPNLANFLSEIALYTDLDQYEDIADKLTLMTVHSAKGLEYDTVIVAGLEEGLFPLMGALDNPKSLEEERRLFYVAATRAKRRLYLTAAHSRFRYGQTESMPSRFISEISAGLVVVHDRRTSLFDPRAGSQERPAQAAPGERVYEYEDEETVKIGRLVQHPVFGRGKVLAVEGRGDNLKVDVQFVSKGKKTLLAKYARLKVVG